MQRILDLRNRFRRFSVFPLRQLVPRLELPPSSVKSAALAVVAVFCAEESQREVMAVGVAANT